MGENKYNKVKELNIARFQSGHKVGWMQLAIFLLSSLISFEIIFSNVFRINFN